MNFSKTPKIWLVSKYKYNLQSALANIVFNSSNVLCDFCKSTYVLANIVLLSLIFFYGLMFMLREKLCAKLCPPLANETCTTLL